MKNDRWYGLGLARRRRPTRRAIPTALIDGKVIDQGRWYQPLLTELKAFLETSHSRLSRASELAKAFRYSLKRWEALTRYTTDGRLEMTNNAAERAIRPLAVGRKNWLFAGSDTGGERAALMYTIIETAKLNGVNAEAYLADLLARIGDHPAKRIEELLPWNWKPAA